MNDLIKGVLVECGIECACVRFEWLVAAFTNVF